MDPIHIEIEILQQVSSTFLNILPLRYYHYLSKRLENCFFAVLLFCYVRDCVIISKDEMDILTPFNHINILVFIHICIRILNGMFECLFAVWLANMAWQHFVVWCFVGFLFVFLNGQDLT